MLVRSVALLLLGREVEISRVKIGKASLAGERKKVKGETKAHRVCFFKAVCFFF